MEVRRVTEERVEEGTPAVSVNAAVAVNGGRGRSSTRVRTKQSVVQRSGKTRITTERDVQTDSEGRG